MSTTELWLISFTFSYLWFDVLNAQYYLKVLFGYQPFDFVKPFDCRYCTYHHFGLIFGSYYLYNEMYIDFGIYAWVNYALTNIMIKIWK